MNIVKIIALIFLIVGGINWGLVGILDFNLVSHLLGAGTIWAKGIYIIIGVSAIYCTSLLRLAVKI